MCQLYVFKNKYFREDLEDVHIDSLNQSMSSFRGWQIVLLQVIYIA